MGSLFSKKKQPNKISQHDKAVLDLKVQRDKLQQYSKKCQVVLAKETEVAKELLRIGKKPAALLALKKKKYQETLLQKTQGQLDNIQQMIDSIEFAQLEQAVFNGLRAGNEVLKELHAQLDIDEINQLMDDTQEAIQYQNEIETALAGKLTEEDEEDILAQLRQLEEEEEDVNQQLPSVPKTEPTQLTTEEPATIGVANKSKGKEGQKRKEMLTAV